MSNNKTFCLILIYFLINLNPNDCSKPPHFVKRFNNTDIMAYYMLCVWNLTSCNRNGYLLKGLIYEQLLNKCKNCKNDLKQDAAEIVDFLKDNPLLNKNVLEYMKKKIN